MSNQANGDGPDQTLRPRVFVMETPQESGASTAEPLAPRVTATAQTGRIAPAPPAALPQTAAPHRRRRYGLTMKLGMAGLIAAFCGWLVVDLYLWIAAAFNFSTGLGWAASAVAAAGIASAGVIVAHEM